MRLITLLAFALIQSSAGIKIAQTVLYQISSISTVATISIISAYVMNKLIGAFYFGIVAPERKPMAQINNDNGVRKYACLKFSSGHENQNIQMSMASIFNEMALEMSNVYSKLALMIIT